MYKCFAYGGQARHSSFPPRPLSAYLVTPFQLAYSVTWAVVCNQYGPTMLQPIRQTYRQMAMAITIAIVIPLFAFLGKQKELGFLRRHISFRIKDIWVRVSSESFSVIYWNPVKKHSTTFSLHFKQYSCLATKVSPYLKAYTDNNAWL